MFGQEVHKGDTNSIMRELMPPLRKGRGGVIKKNRKEMDKHTLVPYHKTREFRKKIAKIYYPIITDYTKD